MGPAAFMKRAWHPDDSASVRWETQLDCLRENRARHGEYDGDGPRGHGHLSIHVETMASNGARK
jgi:hypothetical protein